MKRLADKLRSLGYVDQDGRIYKPLPTLKVERTIEEKPHNTLEDFIIAHKKVLAAKRKTRYNINT